MHLRNGKSAIGGHDDGSTTLASENTPLTDAPNSQAFDTGIPSTIIAQSGQSIDSIEASSPSTQSNIPGTEETLPPPEHQFKCEEYWANGSKCLHTCKRKGDLTRHRKTYHNPSKNRTEANSSTANSQKPKVPVKTRKAAVKTKTATSSKPRPRAKRDSQNTTQPEASVQSQIVVGAMPAAEAESFTEAERHPYDLLSSGHHIGMNTQDGHGEIFGAEAQFSPGTESSQGVKRTTSTMSPYDSQPSFDQAMVVTPYEQQVAHPFVPSENFGQQSDPNGELYGPVGHTCLAPGNQQVYPYSTQDATEVAHQHFLPPDPFGAASPEFTSHGYTQYEAATLPQHDFVESGGLEVGGYDTPQDQTPMISQQQDDFETGGPEDLCDIHDQDWLQMLAEQDPFEDDDLELTSHGFVPEQGRFEKGCFGVEGDFCSCCRERFMEWFPTSDFRQLVEEICVSESVEYYPST